MDPELLRRMVAVDGDHWWYRARRRLLGCVLDELGLPPEARILDAGCGSGASLDQLSAYGIVAGLDSSTYAVEAARARGHADVRLGAVEALPWTDGSFDLVTCLDVLEHTPDDRATLRELRRVTRRGGYAVVTVPAYPSLWSSYDVANHHHRRYGRRSLRAAASAAGWVVQRSSSFNVLLLAPAAALRVAQRVTRSGGEGGSELRLPRPRVNAALERLNAWEARWVGSGRDLPAGLSLLAVLANPEG